MSDGPQNTPSQNERAPRGMRAGRCAIVGRPNVGKSTLLNALLRQKLVIATPRPGTTRSNVLGVYVSDDPPTQVAFLDTPGMERPRNALDRILADTAGNALLQCDAILHLVEMPRGGSDELHPADKRIIEAIKSTGLPHLIAINKIDLVRDKKALLPFMQTVSTHGSPVALVPISALKKDGFADLLLEIRAQLPEGTLYEEDVLTDRPERFFVCELVRESAMQATRQEVPRGIAVTLDRYVEEDNFVHIDATLIVNKNSHKGIVLGAKGATIKQIGIDARKEIERLIERRIMLKLWVKVIPGWTRDPAKARELVKETEDL